MAVRFHRFPAHRRHRVRPPLRPLAVLYLASFGLITAVVGMLVAIAL